MNVVGLFAAGILCAAVLAPVDVPQSMQESPTPRGDAAKPAAKKLDAIGAELQKAFAAQGIHVDLERGLCTFPALVHVREDLLEYLIVNPHGQEHESMFLTDVVPSTLNVALLALGAVPGRNARLEKRDPPPTPEQVRNGDSGYEVRAPEGDGFYLYAAWKTEGETYLYRVEDLVLDRSTGQSMRRHKWVYLGSRMVVTRSDAPGGKDPATPPGEAFAADMEGNLVNVALFEEGNTLITAALPECLKQTIWMTNFWIVPPRDTPVEIVFSRERLTNLPADVEARLPSVPAPKPDAAK